MFSNQNPQSAIPNRSGWIGGIRTRNDLIHSEELCQLSYEPRKKLERVSGFEPEMNGSATAALGRLAIPAEQSLESRVESGELESDSRDSRLDLVRMERFELSTSGF